MTARLRWPVSAYVAVGAVILLSAVAVQRTYAETRDAYRAAGFGDGQIAQRRETMRNLQKIVKVEDCAVSRPPGTALELISFKDETLMVIPIDRETVRFCRY
jgi:hypothetical protein